MSEENTGISCNKLLDDNAFSFNNEENSSPPIATANMATLTKDAIIGNLMPDKLRRGDDVEEFIKECNRYFMLTKTAAGVREITVIALLEKDLRDDYEAIEAENINYEEKLRKAFKKETSFMEDLGKALSYRKGEDSAEVFIRKVGILTKKLLMHKWDEESISKCLLVHCAEDVELEKEIQLRDMETTNDIKKMIKKFDVIKKGNRPINTIKTYSSVTQNRPITRPTQEYVQRRMITCWRCQKEGHSEKQCREVRKIRCYACDEEGHVRRECPNIKCHRCNHKGHREEECYTNLEKQRRSYQNNTRGNIADTRNN